VRPTSIWQKAPATVPSPLPQSRGNRPQRLIGKVKRVEVVLPAAIMISPDEEHHDAIGPAARLGLRLLIGPPKGALHPKGVST
jgi:hypothetical protein